VFLVSNTAQAWRITDIEYSDGRTLAARSSQSALTQPSSSTAQVQQAIHDQLLVGYRQTFVAPAGRTIATVSVSGRATLIELYTGIDTHQYSAVIPLGHETVSFWLGDSHGEPVEPYEHDFIATVQSSTFQ
jgi:hypothetical protein